MLTLILCPVFDRPLETVRQHPQRALQNPRGRWQRPDADVLQPRQRRLAPKNGWDVACRLPEKISPISPRSSLNLVSLLKAGVWRPGRGGGSSWLTAACTTLNTPQWVSLSLCVLLKPSGNLCWHTRKTEVSVILPLVIQRSNLFLNSFSSSRIKTPSGSFLWRICVSGSYKTQANR